ncbi:MAG TPA: hypothetical protein VFP32_02030 [Candidatus Saccharimonadales bacterium]|nr:hypothetical protein [Candidatus Saccharimonadales bacterium]
MEKPLKSFEEEMAEYTAFALGIPMEHAQQLANEASFPNPILVEDVQQLDHEVEVKGE